jgi:membrane protease YdiL (CAAX protease family)
MHTSRRTIGTGNAPGSRAKDGCGEKGRTRISSEIGPPLSGDADPAAERERRRSAITTLGRIALFALLVMVFFATLAPVLERISPLTYESWALAIAAALALAVMARFDRLPLRSFGIGIDRRTPAELLLGFVIGGATMGGVALFMRVAGWYHPLSIAHAPDIAGNLANTLGIFFAIGVYEEVVYRGYVLQTLERRFGTDRALAATMLVFGLAHLFIDIPATRLSLRLIGALSIASEAGVLFGAAYLLRRRLWIPIGVHWAWNFCEGPILGLPVTGGDFGPSLLTAQTTGPLWATGGRFGPEAGMPCLIIGTLAGLAILEAGYRNKMWRHGMPSQSET